MSWIPLTETVMAARANCSAKSAAITNMAAEQQAALQLRHWFTRPFVAMCYRGVRTVQCTQLCGLWAVFVALWCVRCSLVLGGVAAAVCIVAAVVGAITDSSPSSSGYTSSSSPTAGNSTYTAPADYSSTTPVPSTYQPPATPAYYQPPSPVYSDPYTPPPAYGYAGAGPSAQQPKSKFRTEDRKQLAKETAMGLFEGGVRLLAQKYGGGSQPDKVHVNGYQRQDGTYVRPHDRSYPSK